MELINLETFKKDYLNLKDSTTEAIKELESLTGKTVVFKFVNGSQAVGHFKLKIKLARDFMQNHIIIINTDMIKDKEELNYYFVHEIMHGLRVFNANPSDRKILSYRELNTDKIIPKITKTMSPQLLKILGFNLRKYCTDMIFNTNMMLFNTSVDARIEIEIYNKYPDLRELQKKAQLSYLEELLAGFTNPQAKQFTPRWILERVNLMNYCYMKKISNIIGDSWVSKVKSSMNSNFINTSDEMMKYLDKEDYGQLSDNETILEWSKILGLNEFTCLADFENVPFGYEFTN